MYPYTYSTSSYSPAYYTTPAPTSPPEPNPNWVDPLKINRAYLRRIVAKTDFVQEEFKGLHDENLYLIEAFVKRVDLKNILLGESNQKSSPDLSVNVKILHLPFMGVEPKTANQTEPDEEARFNNLFEAMFNVSNNHISLTSEANDEQTSLQGSTDKTEITDVMKGGGIEDTLKEQKVNAEMVGKNRKPVRSNVENPSKDMTSVNIMKGKSALIAMTGIAMIQKLQDHSLVFKVLRNDVKGGEEIVKETILATSLVRVPETLRLAVLRATNRETVLPYLSVSFDKCKLLDTENHDVGSIEIIISLTSFGKLIVNSIRKSSEDEFVYDERKTFRSLENTSSSFIPVNHKLALKVLEMCLPKIKSYNSSEIIRACLDKEKPECYSSAIFPRRCEWFDMVKISKGIDITDRKILKVNENTQSNTSMSQNDYRSKSDAKKGEETKGGSIDRNDTEVTPSSLTRMSRLNTNRLNTISGIMDYCISHNIIKYHPNFNKMGNPKEKRRKFPFCFLNKDKKRRESVKYFESNENKNNSINITTLESNHLYLNPEASFRLSNHSNIINNSQLKEKEDSSVLWMRHQIKCRDFKERCKDLPNKMSSIFARLDDLRIDTSGNTSVAKLSHTELEKTSETRDNRKSTVSKASSKKI